MTVLEYLKTLNGVQEGEKMDLEHIDIGFIDIIPTDKKAKGNVELIISSVDPNILIAQRTIETEGNIIKARKAIPLSDDISLYCGELGTPDQVLTNTIIGLQQLQISSDRRNTGEVFSDRIEIFENAREQYIGDGLKPSHK